MKPAAAVAFTAAAILILIGSTDRRTTPLPVPLLLSSLPDTRHAHPPRRHPQGDPPMTTPENWDAEVNNREAVERVVRGEASI